MEDLVRITFDFWSLLLAFGVFQGLLLLLILLSYRKNSSINFLVGLLFVLILNLFNYLLIRTNLFVEFPHLTHLFIPLMYLIGPIYYWYIKSVLVPNYHISSRNYFFHSIPFLLAILFLLPFYLLGGSEKVNLIEDQNLTNPVPLFLETFGFISLQIIHSFAYIFNASKLLKETGDEQKRQEQTKIRWLRRFSFIFLLYWLIDFLGMCWYTFLGRIHQEIFYVTMLCGTLFINVLVFFAIKNNKDFSAVLLNAGNKKYRNSLLKDSESKLYLQKISRYMEGEKPYLDTELSLTKLAQYLEISSHQVSQVLNLEMGKNFYDFVNEYRFMEARDRLQQSKYKHLTILAIALDSGFSNKNTFNKVFKKHSGLTPSQFLKKHTTFRR
ncbi:MAG: helix-turn-helix domain-containing protein [Cyclobacteriaceae bacterium]